MKPDLGRSDCRQVVQLASMGAHAGRCLYRHRRRVSLFQHGRGVSRTEGVCAAAHVAGWRRDGVVHGGCPVRDLRIGYQVRLVLVLVLERAAATVWCDFLLLVVSHVLLRVMSHFLLLLVSRVLLLMVSYVLMRVISNALLLSVFHALLRMMSRVLQLRVPYVLLLVVSHAVALLVVVLRLFVRRHLRIRRQLPGFKPHGHCGCSLQNAALYPSWCI